jgi:hypothetical protein
MTFSRTTINDELSLPLIIHNGKAASNHHQQPERQQEEQHDRSPTIEAVQGKQQQQRHDPVVKDVVEEHPLVGAMLSCIWCLLLLVQFSISFPSSVIAAPFSASVSTADAITAMQSIQSSSSSFSIYASVLIFFGASLLYRRTIQEVEHDEINSNTATKVPAVLHLLPELVTVMTIGSCYGGHAMAGLVIMVTGAFVMASAVVAYCTVALWSSTRNNNKKNEAASTATTCCCPAEQTLARDDVADDAVVRPV